MTTSQQTLKFNRQFFKDLFSLIKPYWTSSEKPRAYLLLSLVIFCIVIQVSTNVALNYYYKNLFNALQAFQRNLLPHMILEFAVLATCLILVVGYNVYFSGLLGIRWRRWMTEYYQKKWLQKHNYYKMQILNKNVDNPDQRISDDLNVFPSTTISFFTTLLTSALTLLFFGYILWNLSVTQFWNVGNKHFVIAGYLFWSAVVYAIIGSWFTGLIGKRLTKLNYEQQFYNADFRFSLVRTREASEQIALYGGEKAEDKHFRNLFTRIYDNFVKTIKVQKYLMFFQNGYNITNYAFGIFIGMPLYFEKKIQLGGIIQISGAFGEVIAALSLFVTLYASLADWRSVIYRLTEFSRTMKAAEELSESFPISVQKQDKNQINTTDLNIYLPNNSLLLKNINLTINPGETVLINGSSGAGKSTLLRTLAGIWPYANGTISIPADEKILFLPQKPYLPIGTLRQVLTYPFIHENFSDEQLREALTWINLAKLSDRLDQSSHWTHELSLGEQQLIAFARIFLHKPQWVFLDEATSALDETNEMQIYENLNKLLPQITIITVGHRSTLKNFHVREITLQNSFLTTINDNNQTALNYT